MAVLSDKARWKKWADNLRQEMMVSLTPEVCKPIEAIMEESETTKTEKRLRSAAFWKACQGGTTANDAIVVAGFEIDYNVEDDGTVCEVTFKLNSTWHSIMQKVLDRAR
ncbi:MAG: hypothetical protein AB8B50_18215 [Pirellulaceae bacterium]